jgi:replication factor A1
LTLWGGKAVDSTVKFDDEILIIALKGAKLGDFQGRTLTTVASTSVVYNPPQGLELYNWAARYGEGGAKLLQTICLSGGG